MATTTINKAAPRFYEIVIQGPHDLAHGYMCGLVMGSGHDATYFNASEEGVDGPTLKSRTKAFLHILPHENHFIVDNLTRGLLKKGLKTMHLQTGLELESERQILKAHFNFVYTAYANTYSKQIDALLKTIPRGVKLVNYDIQEQVDKSAKGLEAYAPAHDFEIHGSGEIRGRIDQVVAARKV